MDWFRNLKIAHKLYLLVAVASFFILLVSAIGYYFNVQASKSAEIMYKENLVAMYDLGQMRGNLNKLLRDVLVLFQFTTPAETEAITSDIKIQKQNSTDAIAEFLKTNLTEAQKAKLGELKAMRVDFWNKIDTEIALASVNKNAQAYNIYKTNNANVEKYEKIVRDLIKMQDEDSQKAYDENVKATTTAKVLLILIGIFSLVFMVSVGIIIANAITKPIQRAIGELTTGSSEVSAASAQIEAESESLAEGTTQQAASIQETSSTLEETSSMVQQNNENTKQASVLAKNAKSFAMQSTTEMHTMMKSMEDLKQSSNEISKIIKVIDEIAFQTNILSLNAAVEAARAGDAGKGFAVVAEEVRNLAQRSAQAAKDTASIIENNITLSENSAEVAKHVNDSLTQIDAEAKKVSDLLDEISTATEEQSRGVQEISKAIQQMEQVVQSNAATADESSAASRELASQAANVNEIVGTLIKLVEGTNAINTANRTLITNANRNARAKSSISSRNNSMTSTQSKAKSESIIPLNDDF